MDPEMIGEKKEQHLQQARDILKDFYEYYDHIRNPEVKQKLEYLIGSIKDLRDTQYLFDSGEKDLDRLYDRILPYLKLVIGNYIELEDSWNTEEIANTRPRLLKAIDQVSESVDLIRKSLPDDEVTMAKAEAQAKKAKQKLDDKYGKTGM